VLASVASTLEGVLYFKGRLVYTRDPSGSMCQGLQLDQLTVDDLLHKPSNISIHVGIGGSNSTDQSGK